MGKNKIDLTQVIEDENKRSKAFFKRKKCFLRKGMELSNLCNLQIFSVIYDPEK